MVGFGDRIQARSFAAWKLQYVDYKGLKKLINKICRANQRSSSLQSPPLLTVNLSSEFEKKLFDEIANANSFFLEKVVELREGFFLLRTQHDDREKTMKGDNKVAKESEKAALRDLYRLIHMLFR
jgi:SPX domain protein involved in polyphosphate accumulation